MTLNDILAALSRSLVGKSEYNEENGAYYITMVDPETGRAYDVRIKPRGYMK